MDFYNSGSSHENSTKFEAKIVATGSRWIFSLTNGNILIEKKLKK